MSKFDRSRLVPPHPIPKVNRPKIEGEMIEWIQQVLDKMLPIVKRTQYQEIVYKFKGVIRPIFVGSIDYGRLPYGNIGAVRNRNRAECLFSMLARAFMHWWDYLIGEDKKLKIFQTTLKHLEDILDNIDQYELRSIEKIGYRLCKKKSKTS